MSPKRHLCPSESDYRTIQTMNSKKWEFSQENLSWVYRRRLNEAMCLSGLFSFCVLPQFGIIMKSKIGLQSGRRKTFLLGTTQEPLWQNFSLIRLGDSEDSAALLRPLVLMCLQTLMSVVPKLGRCMAMMLLLSQHGTGRLQYVGHGFTYFLARDIVLILCLDVHLSGFIITFPGRWYLPIADSNDDCTVWKQLYSGACFWFLRLVSGSVGREYLSSV